MLVLNKVPNNTGCPESLTE